MQGLLIKFCVPGIITLLTGCPYAFGQQDPTCEQIIQRFIDQVKPQDAKNLKQQLVEGEIESTGTTVKIKFKDGKYRIEKYFDIEELKIRTDDGEEIVIPIFAGMDKYICGFDGEKAWTQLFLPDGTHTFTVTEESESMIERFACHLFAVNLSSIEGATMLGKKKFGIDEAWCIEFRDPEDNDSLPIVKRYFDVESALLLGTEYVYEKYNVKRRLDFEWKQNDDKFFTMKSSVYKSWDASGNSERTEFDVTGVDFEPDFDDQNLRAK